MDASGTPQPLHRHPRFHAIKGSSWQAIGWLTADRHVEAAGAAEHELLEKPPPEVVAEMEHLVHERYGEVLPARFDPPGTY